MGNDSLKISGNKHSSEARGMRTGWNRRPISLSDSHMWIIALLLLFTSVRILMIFKFHEFFWDESVYIGIGKYIFSGGSIGLWESIRPPVLPLMLGFLWWLGLDITMWSEAVIAIFALGLIYVTYRLARNFMPAIYSALAAFTLAMSPIFFSQSIRVLTEVPSAFFIMLSLLLYIEKRSLFLVGAATALAFLTKFPQGLIIAALFLLIVIDWTLKRIQTRSSSITRKNIQARKRDLFRKLTDFSSGVLAVVAPYLIFNMLYHSRELSNLAHATFRPFLLAFEHQSNIHESVPGFIYNITYYAIEMVNDNPLILLATLGIGASINYLLFSKRSRISLSKSGIGGNANAMKHLSLILPLMLLFSYYTYIINKQLRFGIAFLPILCILSAYGLMVLMRSIKHSIHIPSFRNILYIMIAIPLAFAALNTLSDNYSTYDYLPEGMPEYIRVLCFEMMDDMESPILTSFPECIAYRDILMIPYYQDLIVGPTVYEANLPRSASVLYHDRVFPCIEGDTVCMDANTEFFRRIMDENIIEKNISFYGTEYYYFRTLFR